MHNFYFFIFLEIVCTEHACHLRICTQTFNYNSDIVRSLTLRNVHGNDGDKITTAEQHVVACSISAASFYEKTTTGKPDT